MALQAIMETSDLSGHNIVIAKDVQKLHHGRMPKSWVFETIFEGRDASLGMLDRMKRAELTELKTTLIQDSRTHLPDQRYPQSTSNWEVSAANMAHLAARANVSPDSGFPVTLHPHFNPKIKDHVPPEPPHKERTPAPDRGLFANPDKKSLLSIPGIKVVPLTESIGTVLENVQLSALTPQQLDELALLVNERGVVFFRSQDLTTEGQVKLFEHYGELDRHPSQKDTRHHVIRGSTIDHREILAYTPWPSGDFHADTSFEINPPSYSMLRMEEHPPVGGDTAWVSSYGLYDTLSDAMKYAHCCHCSHMSFVS